MAGAAVAAGLGTGCKQPAPRAGTKQADTLDLRDFQPKSMLHVTGTKVEKARFPVIDFHTHLSWAAKGEAGVPLSEDRQFIATAQELLEVMDRKNLKVLINTTGGPGAGVRQSVEHFDKAHPGRFFTFTEPWYAKITEPDYPKFQADAIEKAHQDGARGLKILKTLGLYLRQNVTAGPLIKVDDPRFDPMWDACGALKMPVGIHVSDPEAFFLPIDRFNERWEELHNHPDWSFHGKDFPSNMELLEARNRMIAKHPKTQFVVFHVGNDAENLAYVGECMDKFPNMHVDIGARIGELGRQPRTSRKFFDKYQDRIVFGTDATPHGDEFPQQLYGDKLYEIYFRFLETEDEYFDYAPAAVPPQGRWQIYGIGLPQQILKKVYYDNAARLLGLKA
ncbi:MAG: amidohydrolase family protein [Bryobacterales bacterium]|nr:amidohydrolase family protein [Bryobacterales bacterium]